MRIGPHDAQQYRDFATQCLERAQSATTGAERLYFVEQAAVWHRLAEARDDDRTSSYFTLGDPSPHKRHVD